MRAQVLRGATLVAVALAATGATLAAPGYNRYPDIHGDRIVFCAEGDLWLVGDPGGAARRVTAQA